MEHGVEVVAVMVAGTGGGSGVRSDGLFALVLDSEVSATEAQAKENLVELVARFRGKVAESRKAVLKINRVETLPVIILNLVLLGTWHSDDDD